MKIKKLLMMAMATVIASGCGQDPMVAAAKKQHAEFVGIEPRPVDVVGTYFLIDQTVVPGGVSALDGRTCEIEVRADGTFSVTNYPVSSGGAFTSFDSATGSWRLATVGTSYGYGPNPKDCWGFRFEGMEKRLDPTAFTGPEQPFGLLTILGDPDSNLTLRFKRKGHPTTPPTVPSPASGAGEVR